MGLEGLDHANCFIIAGAALLDNGHLYQSLEFIEEEDYEGMSQLL
jgi:hypothetical protein